MVRPPPKSTLFPYPPLFRAPAGPPAPIQRAPEAPQGAADAPEEAMPLRQPPARPAVEPLEPPQGAPPPPIARQAAPARAEDRKSTRLNSSHANISYAVFCFD